MFIRRYGLILAASGYRCYRRDKNSGLPNKVLAAPIRQLHIRAYRSVFPWRKALAASIGQRGLVCNASLNRFLGTRGEDRTLTAGIRWECLRSVLGVTYR